MGKSRVLFSWLGNGDISNTSKNGKLSGALWQAIEKYRPDQVCILNGQSYRNGKFSDKDISHYLKKLKDVLDGRLTVGRVDDFNPIDYREICSHVIPFLENHYDKSADTYFLQTSGTPSMAVVWILLAQTRFPATLIQASAERGAEIVDLPFNVFADFVPQEQDRLINDSLVPEGIIYNDGAMKRVVAQATRIALHCVPVLLLGESGTGKELFAKHIHKASGMKGEFVPINCGAIPLQLVESELFGHKKGAFTGADSDHAGVFVRANNGTLFLDEVGELPLESQVKLLRVLQDGIIMPVGGDDNSRVEVNVRIICATHRDLRGDVAVGRFREDLYYRLAVGVVKIPPLRERGDDVLLLAEHFLKKTNEKFGDIEHYVVKKFDSNVKITIKKVRWQGNVRELENTILRVCLWSDEEILKSDEFEAALLKLPDEKEDIIEQAIREKLGFAAVEKCFLERAYAVDGSVKTTCELYGKMSRQAISAKLKKHGIR